MKKQLSLVIALMLFTFFSLSSCKKDQTTAPSKSENISRSSWKFSSATAVGIGDISNNPAISCIKDDAITFQSNGNGTITEGSIVCSPTTAGNFTWTFENNETKLMMSAGLFPGGSGLFDLVSLNETTLVVSQNVSIPPNPSVLVTATYIH